MLLFFMFFLIILQTVINSGAAATCEISLNSNLTPSSSSWLSPSGRFAFGFYQEGSSSGGGFKVGIRLIYSPNKTTVIWTSKRDDTPVSSSAALILGNEGLKLLRANSQGEEQTISALDQSSSAYCASMQDSGDFVIYDSNLTVLWQTFDHPTDTLMVGQLLFSGGTELISSVSETNHSRGRFRLAMQTDGNLVMYPVVTDANTAYNAYWASDTFSQPYTKLNLSDNGILFLTDNNQSLHRNLTKGDQSNNPNTTIHLARIEPNGLLQVYAYDLLENKSTVLDKIPDDQCQVKGACGLNSYCTYSGGTQVCLCLPYFDYVNDEDTQAGCQRNFISNTCLGVGDNDTHYNTMDDLENVKWLREPLHPAEHLTSEDDCRDSCLHDCNCDVAIYNGDGGSCSKQSLPLKYGSKVTGTSNPTITFIKRTDRRNTTAEGGIGVAPIIRVKKELSGGPLIVFVAVVAGLIIFILAFIFVVFKWRAQVGRYRMICRSNDLALTDGLAPRSFSYYELCEATEGFNDEVGKGAFGTVFRGTLHNTGKLVAVKRLEKLVEEGEREFQTEMKAIGRTHHRNLVRLLGFCKEGSNRLLVYEFMTNGSLADHIFKPDQNRPHWKERLRIALDVARGIHYLHEDCETHIIHCDIKPQNILMDENWIAKISDFGLAKLLMPTQTRTFTGIRGTRGYLAPEWHKNTPITVKADVYSFGIVLLEILCCRKNMELEAEVDQIILSEWVYNCYLAGELEKLTLDEEVDMVEFRRLVTVGLWCIQTDPTQRPSMKNVILMLEGCAEISSLPPP